jgi:ammonium transporter Rh
MKGFVVVLVVVEIIIVALYGVFVRFQKPSTSTLNSEFYPAYQDVNVMMLIGFGYLMAFSKSFSWSAVSYTFFINAISVQLYILLSAFWKRVIVTSFEVEGYYIYINETTFTAGLYSAASMLIAVGCSIGRVGPL